jgi:hypothetical protein
LLPDTASLARQTPRTPPGHPPPRPRVCMADEGVKSLLRTLPPWSGALRGEEVFLLIRAHWLDAAGAPRAWAGNASTRAQLRRALNALPELFAKGEPDPVTGELFWSYRTSAPANLAALAQAATAVASAPPRGVWCSGASREPVFACLAALTPPNSQLSRTRTAPTPSPAAPLSK